MPPTSKQAVNLLAGPRSSFRPWRDLHMPRSSKVMIPREQNSQPLISYQILRPPAAQTFGGTTKLLLTRPQPQPHRQIHTPITENVNLQHPNPKRPHGPRAPQNPHSRNLAARSALPRPLLPQTPREPIAGHRPNDPSPRSDRRSPGIALGPAQT